MPTTALALVGVALVAYASTNIDNLVVLTLFFADPALRTRHVVLGQHLGIFFLIAISILGAFVALLVPATWVRWLGIVPLLMGLSKLVQAARRGSGERALDADAPLETPPGRLFGTKTLAVSLVAIANGGDNVSVYVPLFASVGAARRAAIAVLFLVCTTAWCALGYALVRNPLFGERVAYLGRRVVPFVWIGIGLFVLFKDRLF